MIYRTERIANHIISSFCHPRIGCIKIPVLRWRNAKECHSERVTVLLFSYRHIFLVELHIFFTTFDLLLSFYRSLRYNTRDHCPLLQCLNSTNVVIAGANPYFVVLSFKCEGKNSCNDLIPNSRVVYMDFK